ncbi:MAG: glycogen-binding domain-containing protein, partial [Candidatus Eisenbacteria bacterium]|nr:glycogen-binding domain-containing protein [Candidatus Eisenbacteria bacterium]
LLSGCTGLSFIKKRLPPPQITEKGVLFQFYSPSAQIVQVCGNWDTNNWCSGLADTGGFRIGAMEDPDGDGLWELFVKLPAGRYQYKFIIDEQNWKTDPNNPQRTDDGYGGSNSVLIVD